MSWGKDLALNLNMVKKAEAVKSGEWREMGEEMRKNSKSHEKERKQASCPCNSEMYILCFFPDVAVWAWRFFC